MICVYPADCKDFSNNGLGIVLPQSCTVTETLNGEWELTLTHPIDVDGKWTRLTEGCILRAPVPAAMTPQVGLVTQQYGIFPLWRSFSALTIPLTMKHISARFMKKSATVRISESACPATITSRKNGVSK